MTPQTAALLPRLVSTLPMLADLLYDTGLKKSLFENILPSLSLKHRYLFPFENAFLAIFFVSSSTDCSSHTLSDIVTPL